MKKTKFLTVIITYLVVFYPQLALADEAAFRVENSWARESPPLVKTGAVYLTLINSGAELDRLTSISGDVAKIIELHTHLHENGMMKMRPLDSVDIAPDKPAVFEPGGSHIMLIELTKPLQKGQVFPLTLHFENAADLRIDVPVKGLGE
jgi:copper(I)-binding protein